MKKAPSPKTGQGYFSPDDPYWYVNRELLVLLAGSRALLLELAHPLVAAGVVQHSNFRQNPLGRLYRTVWMMVDVSFGNIERVRQAAGRVNRCHHAVKGNSTDDTKVHAAGTGYQANDPQLKLWVLATLIDSILQTHNLLIRPLSQMEQEAFYQDWRILGQLMGIPVATMPATYPDFARYMEKMLTGDTLTVSNTAHQVLDAIFSGPFGPALKVASFVGIGLLPARLRTEFYLPWNKKQEKRLQRLAAFTRRVRPWLPAILCVWPQAIIAEWRQGKEERKSGGWKSQPLKGG